MLEYYSVRGGGQSWISTVCPFIWIVYPIGFLLPSLAEDLDSSTGWPNSSSMSYFRNVSKDCICSVPLKMDCKDSLKNRIRIFTEAVVVMVCPVLLSFALKKVDLTANRSKQIVDSISPIGALTLEAGILPFLGLCLSTVLGERLAWLVLASKLLIHLCVILLMALAFVILLLISKSNIVCLSIWIPFIPFILWLGYNSVKYEEHENADDATKSAHHGKLEISVDFSASITSLLFLGLEGLALEGQASAIKGLDAHLSDSLIVSFVTCVLGVVFMLVGTAPPVYGMGRLVDSLRILDTSLAIAFGVIVVLITIAPLKEAAWLVSIPWILSFFVWLFIRLFDHDEGEDRDVKPVSLELTKAAFTGFLAVSIPSFSNSSTSGGYTHAFIVLTGSAVLAGLAWRLITHVKKPSRAMVWAENLAIIYAHGI
uniref:Lysyl-tRNA synthetase N-terminal transmembrane region domain-containing protein n=1 Tax=Oryza rufipogon TaxID=4529 RepID=A0A0E0MVZ3_ORYRU